jgi:DNA-binding MarR family transcriptional regulator
MDKTDEHQADAALWLDKEQQRAWRALAKLYTKLPATLDSELQRTAGITLFEYQALALLAESDRRTLQMSELAAGTNSSLSRLSHVISRLEKRGRVTRQICPTDGRAAQAALTESGLAKVIQAAPGHVRAVRDLVIDALIPAQLRQLGTAAAKIGHRIEERNAARAANATSR